MSRPPSSPPSPKRPRVGFVDAARALAMLLMVQGHVCDTLLEPLQKATALYAGYQGLRGLTAPLFFLLSGFAVVVASDSRWAAFGRRGPALYGRLRRAGALLLLGHLLQMPRWSGLPPFDFTRDEWAYVLRCGVLDCVAWSLLVAHLLMALTRTRRGFTIAAAGLAAGVLLATPFVAGYHGPLPLPVALLVRADEGSLFPLFPYLAPFFFGATLARLYLDSPRLAGRPARIALIAAAVGAVAYAVGASWLAREPWRIDAPNSDLALFLARAGKGWLIFAAVAALVGRAPSPGWLRSVASNALSIYVLHLVVIYGAPGLDGLIAQSGDHLDLGEAFLLGPALLASCAAAMAVWDATWPRLRALAVSAWAAIGSGGGAELDRVS